MTITLNRPAQLNCQTPHTWTWLDRLARALPATVRVAVLRGAGSTFSAGLDRVMFTADGVEGSLGAPQLAALPAAEFDAQVAGWQRAFDWTSSPALVSVTAVQGYAIGAGFQLALGTDIRIAADDAQFCMAEATLGLVPDMGGTKRLVDLVGYSRAAEICLTGRRVDAQEALTMGLISRVVARADLDEQVHSTVTALCAIDRDAAAETKALLLGASARSQRVQQAAERDAQYRRLRALAGLDAED